MPRGQRWMQAVAAMKLPTQVLDHITRSSRLRADLAALVGCGGRFAGSESEVRARDWLMRRLRTIPTIVVREHTFQFEGWRRQSARLLLLTTPNQELACHPLIYSPDTPGQGLLGEVINLGRGTSDDFDRLKGILRGRIALVHHEHPFTRGVVHRRVKYNRSRDEGCVGFIIANNLADAGLVTGSSGHGTAQDIPAVGITYAGSQTLIGTDGRPVRVRLDVKSERFKSQATNIVVDVPTSASETIVVCAHYDGHDLAGSALDNATGVAAAIQILESLIPQAAVLRRNLRVIFFTNEEWGLMGSRLYVDSLSDDEIKTIAMVVNLDTLAGSSRLAALTSGFEDLAAMVADIASTLDEPITIVPEIFANSDHFNFARRGVPAVRLVAGFDDPRARTRYLLTAADTLDKVELEELRITTTVAAEIVWQALIRPILPRHKTVDGGLARPTVRAGDAVADAHGQRAFRNE